MSDMKKSLLLLFKYSCILLLLTNAVSAIAQPAFSRGIQIISAGHDECMRRASNALLAEGYVNLSSGGDYYAGFKGINTAVITCNATADGRTYVNIFVASQTNDSGLPGGERVRLQGRMDNSTSIITPSAIQADWNTQADTYRGKNGERHTYYLPPGGKASGRLWGTDVYTDDSSIGTAAVHAGLINFQNGGTVTIEIRTGQPTYQGSSRNGVSSNSYGYWYGSFLFVR